MAMESGTRTKAIVAAAAVAVALAGYWGYGAYQKRELRNSVGAVLKSSAGHLRAAVAAEGGPAPADRLELAKKIDGYAAAADSAIAQVKRLPVQRDLALTDDADGYLVTAREIFRKQAVMNRSHQLYTDSLRALNEHMRADSRTGAWVGQAVIAKDRAERDFRDFRMASTSYVMLLEGLPATEKKVESVIGAESVTPPEQLTQARARVLATVKDAEKEIDFARRLVGPR
jgi:hypothetical protein